MWAPSTSRSMTGTDVFPSCLWVTTGSKNPNTISGTTPNTKQPPFAKLSSVKSSTVTHWTNIEQLVNITQAFKVACSQAEPHATVVWKCRHLQRSLVFCMCSLTVVPYCGRTTQIPMRSSIRLFGHILRDFFRYQV